MAHHTAASRLRAEVTKWFAESDGEPPDITEMEAIMHVLLNAPDLCWLALEESGLVGKDIWPNPTAPGAVMRRYERSWRALPSTQARATADPTAEGGG
jgi:hypothetical protein